MDYCVIELPSHDIWLQAKSRKHGSFSETEVQKILTDVNARAIAVKEKREILTAVVLEQSCSNNIDVGLDQLFNESAGNVLICRSPGEESVRLLTAQLNTAEVIADGIVSDLYRLIADAARACCRRTCAQPS